jgi:hypothetical protein
MLGRWIHWYWQNLNDDDGRREPGKPWSGRAWARLNSNECRSPGIRLEWHLGKYAGHLGASFDWGWGDSNDEIMLHVGIPYLASLYLTLEHVIPEWLRPIDYIIPPEQRHPGSDGKIWGSREIGVRVHDGSIWLSFWHEWTGWGPHRQKVIHVVDTLLGRGERGEKQLGIYDETLSLPEGDYPVTVQIVESSFTRPRWPWPTVDIFARVESERWIAFPGRGEAEWDMGDDATRSHSANTTIPTEAVESFRQWILDRRLRYGGADWMPQETEG